MVAAAEFVTNGKANTAPLTPRTPSKSPIPDYETKFSEEAIKREMPALRQLACACQGKSDIIPMNAGLPPSDVFPMESIQVNFKDGTSMTIDDASDIIYAQQYNLVLKGHPKIMNWIEAHSQAIHRPPGGHETVVTSGSNPSLEIIFKMFLNPGDPLLIEEYTYAHVPESMLDPSGYKTVPVRADSGGIIPSSLEENLTQLQARGQPLPKLLYTIPVGQNPTGSCISLERKEQVYALCRKFDILILEDDPYYYLQFEAGKEPKGLKGLIPSYLSMDTDCRVIRLDTFSKVLIPGLRLGWITAHPQVISKFIYHFHGVNMGSSSMSQIMMGALLEKMGPDGFEQHLKAVQAKYSNRAGIVMAAAERHLTGLAEWAPVTAGMFMWLKLKKVDDVNAILPDLQAVGVIVVPGTLALHSYPNVQGAVSNCIRLSFVTAKEEALEEGIQKIASVLKRFPLPQRIGAQC